MKTRDEILAAVDGLATTVHKRGDRRAPHKPLLLLFALARLRARPRGKLSFQDVERGVRPLLDAFAPPVKGRHQPQLPYWHLQSDCLWKVDGADELPRQRGGFPRIKGLRESEAGFPRSLSDALIADPGLVDAIARRLLGEHFPESLHAAILDQVGFELGTPSLPEHAAAAGSRQARDPAFRANVLRAYGHRCALTRFHAQLRGAHLGIEAAHVHWHSHGGPDTIANGLALQPTMHKLFDAGAWSLTDDRRVIVSQDLTGTDETTSLLRDLHGKRIGAPLKGFSPVSVEFIHWHREPEHGGVFREPALPL